MSEIDALKKKMAEFLKDKPTTAMFSPTYRSMRYTLYTLGFRPTPE